MCQLSSLEQAVDVQIDKLSCVHICNAQAHLVRAGMKATVIRCES